MVVAKKEPNHFVCYLYNKTTSSQFAVIFFPFVMPFVCFFLLVRSAFGLRVWMKHIQGLWSNE